MQQHLVLIQKRRAQRVCQPKQLPQRCHPSLQASAAEWGARLAAAEEQLGALKAGAEAADSDEEEGVVDAARLEELEELAQRVPDLEAQAARVPDLEEHAAQLEGAVVELQAARVRNLACQEPCMRCVLTVVQHSGHGVAALGPFGFALSSICVWLRRMRWRRRQRGNPRLQSC